MAQEIADSKLLDTWASSGVKINPDISKIIEGWQLGEQPPHEYMNWLQNTFGSKLNHIFKNGVAKWENEKEYLAGSSVQHSNNVWLCKTTNTNSEPTDVNTNWKRIITVETLTTVLGGYVALTGNQTIAGIKTFSLSPIVPTPTTDFQAANKEYVDDKYSGFKNYIINGKKVINQRNLTSADNSYNQDRWYKAGNNWYQGIEGDNNLISGKKYTLSWVDTATASYYVGTATSSTINAQSFTAIANGGNFTLTISAGQNLWIKFASDSTGSTFNFVQLEEGSVATPFENRPYGLELSLCQRYYERSPSIVGLCIPESTTYEGCAVTWVFKQTKRIMPTITITHNTGTKPAMVRQYNNDGCIFSPSVQATWVLDYIRLTATASAEL